MSVWCFLEPLKIILTRLNALQYTKVKVISARYAGECAQSYLARSW